MAISTFPAASSGGGGGGALVKKVFASTDTWTAPSDVDTVTVTLVGGGGGGGAGNSSNGSGGGGGGAGVVCQTIAVTPGASYTVTIGAGGAGSDSSGTGGSAGSDSTFGNLLTAYAGGMGLDESYYNYDDWGTAGYDPKNMASPGGQGSYISSQNIASAGGGAGAGSAETSMYLSNNIQASNKPMQEHHKGRQGYGYARHPAADSGIYAGGGGHGINGYGGGGSAAYYSTKYDNAFYTVGATDGGGWGATQSLAAENGEANKGGGGGAGWATTNQAGGNGGSGVCILEYWTAA